PFPPTDEAGRPMLTSMVRPAPQQPPPLTQQQPGPMTHTLLPSSHAPQFQPFMPPTATPDTPGRVQF
ncbi:MAG: hypothetical protein AB7I48_28020, partial [Planctomycetaceae bacterium]